MREEGRSEAISRILSPAFALGFRPWATRGDDHSARPAIAGGIQRPTRGRRTGRPNRRTRRRVPPYLVLLRAGFCLPPTSRPARCALTAPFHHCHPCGFGCVFSVPLS